MGDFKRLTLTDKEGKLISPADYFRQHSEQGDKEIQARKTGEQTPRGYLAEPNTTQTPNLLFDYFIPGIDDLDDLKVLLYIVRHTFGYGKKEGAFLTQDQILHGVKRVNKTTEVVEIIDFGSGMKLSGDDKNDRVRLTRIIKKLEALCLVEVMRGQKVKNSDKYPTNFYRCLVMPADSMQRLLKAS